MCAGMQELAYSARNLNSNEFSGMAIKRWRFKPIGDDDEPDK